jgi:glutamine synthetase
VLAGMLHGLEHRVEPPPVVTGNAYAQQGEALPVTWPQALERFERSDFARQALGEAFVKLFATVKRGEMEEFNSHITPLEIQRYLGPL